MQVHMSMFDLGGRFIKDIINGKMAQGNYAISAESRDMSSQFYVVRISIDGVSHVMNSHQSPAAALRHLRNRAPSCPKHGWKSLLP